MVGIILKEQYEINPKDINTWSVKGGEKEGREGEGGGGVCDG